MASARRAHGWHTDEERRRWTAVEAVFGEGGRLVEAPNADDPDLLWAVRRLLQGEEFEKRAGPALAPRTMARLVRAFRGQWPNASLMPSFSAGDTNPWNASEFVATMISRLANDTTEEAVAELNKGQWHAELWSAAAGQLDPRYTTDWRAHGRGIYLVLWFGPGVGSSRSLKTPPAGVPKPTSALELRDALIGVMPVALRERISVVVLDLSPA